MARRLAGFMIDCRGDDLAGARNFWSRALGLPILDPDEGAAGRYALLGKGPGGWHIETQCVAHDSRLHLDIEATDIDAEADRLELLGATRVASPTGRWWVMPAPTGHRFCVVRLPHDRARQPGTAVAEGGGLVAKQRQVVLGQVLGNDYTLVSGLVAGDRIVTSGIQKIGDGAPIQQMAPAAAAPGAGGK